MVRHVESMVLKTPVNVYNIEVQEVHNYYVTEKNILTLNGSMGLFNRNLKGI